MVTNAVTFLNPVVQAQTAIEVTILALLPTIQFVHSAFGAITALARQKTWEATFLILQ
jgi:hypothetical protein